MNLNDKNELKKRSKIVHSNLKFLKRQKENSSSKMEVEQIITKSFTKIINQRSEKIEVEMKLSMKRIRKN